jgi:hypothetical protein
MSFLAGRLSIKPISFVAISFFLLFPLIVIARAADAALSISTVEEEIRSAGAQATVRDLWRSQLKWNVLLQNIQSGDRTWLKVADDLKSGADGGQLETLRIAVSQSIQKDAGNFLAVAWPVFGDDTCHDLQIEPTAKQHNHFISATRQALSRVTEDNLRSRRYSCLRALTGTQAH